MKSTLLILAILLFGSRGQAQTSFSIESKLSFAPNKAGIFLPVSFQGKQFLFLLDTGTSFMVYDESFRSVLGKPVKRQAIGSPSNRWETNDVFQAPDARLANNLSLATSEPVICDRLDDYRKVSGIPMYGVIGMTFLRRHPVYLDFESNEVCFVRTNSAGPTNALPPVPFMSPLYISILLPTGKETVMLDTGTWDFGALSPTTFDELVRLHKISPKGAQWITSRGAPQLLSRGRLESFSFMRADFRGATFDRDDPSRLGWGFMTNFNWLLDFPNDTIIAEPPWRR